MWVNPIASIPEAMASLPVRSIRPLFKIKDPELLANAILDVEKAASIPDHGRHSRALNLTSV